MLTVLYCRHAQIHSVWAWDIEARKMVLIIFAILAMLGDNPMQSELACHVGLQGKLFCRNCWVKGLDSHTGQTSVEKEVTHTGTETHSNESKSHILASDDGSAQEVLLQTKGRGRRSETMQELVDRARRFLGVSYQLALISHAQCLIIFGPNPPRTRQDTVNRLQSMFQEVTSGMGKTRYTKTKTVTVIKNTHMDVFVKCILQRVKGIHARTGGYHHTVEAVTQGRPIEWMMSLIWRIKGKADPISLIQNEHPFQVPILIKIPL